MRGVRVRRGKGEEGKGERGKGATPTTYIFESLIIL